MSARDDARLLVGDGQWLTFADPASRTRAVRVSDGPTGVRREEDGDTLPATCFPPAATLAASWDSELVRDVGAALGEEAALLGVDVLLAPGVNLKRTPLCGRNFEYFAEDPLVAGVLGAAYVAGVQSRGVGASLKHFAANNQEAWRHSISADVAERPLRELYLAAFERIVREADPWTVMCSYNRLNGTHASEHHWLLTQVLRGEWGYSGLVVSDWGAVHDPVAAVAAGLDLQMPGDDGTALAKLHAALEAGMLDATAVAQAADRVRRLARRCGASKAISPVDEVAAAHHGLARRAAAAGTILLSNHSVLPLAPRPGSKLVVIGLQAVEPVLQGGGSAEVVPSQVSTLADALTARLADVLVEFARGYDYEELDEGRPVPRDPASASATALREQAVAAASGADLVVVCLGHPHGVECEGYDRTGIDLPADQELLVSELMDVPVPVVVSLTTGAPLALGPWRHRASAVLVPGFGGQAGGEALADVLLGETEPGGRLTETWPLRLADTPAAVSYPGERGVARYGEGVFIGYRWYDALDREVAYPFGHGLGFGKPSVTSLDASVLDAEAGSVRVRVGVANTGERAGSAVVQVYVGEDEPLVQRPPRELRGFVRVWLEPGQEQTVEVDLDARAWAFWDEVTRCWQRRKGTFTIWAGLSSRDLAASAGISLPADPTCPPLIDEEELAVRLQLR